MPHLEGWLEDNAINAIMPTRTSDPGTDELDKGEAMIFISSGGGTGSDGDVIVAANDGGSIKTLNVGSPS